MKPEQISCGENSEPVEVAIDGLPIKDASARGKCTRAHFRPSKIRSRARETSFPRANRAMSLSSERTSERREEERQKITRRYTKGDPRNRRETNFGEPSARWAAVNLLAHDDVDTDKNEKQRGRSHARARAGPVGPGSRRDSSSRGGWQRENP